MEEEQWQREGECLRKNMNALPTKKSIEELLEKETPEQTEKERTEALQQLKIYLCKTPSGRRFWRNKARHIKGYVMGSSSELPDFDDVLLQKNT
jgi:hypothetical protein